MKVSRILIIALLLLILPIAGRALWFYQGVYQRTTPVATPDYQNIVMPFPTLSTPPAPTKAELAMGRKPVVLFDQAHGGLYTLSELDALVQALTNLGSRIETSAGSVPLKDQLKSAQAYVVIAPTLPFTPEEISAINRFVEQGGHLLVVADPTREYGSGQFSDSPAYGSVDIANLLLASFSITFVNDYVYNLVENEGNFRNVYARPAAKTDLVRKVSRVALYSAHSINAAPDQVVMEGSDNTLSSKTDQGGELALAAASSNGRVLAIGDLTFLTPPYNQVADNGQFIQNLALFLSANERAHNLLDFPYLFKQPVALLLKQEEPLEKDSLKLVSQLQQNLEKLNVSMTIAEKPLVGSDLILFATFDHMDRLDEYLAPFHLKYSLETAPTPAETDQAEEKPIPAAEMTPTPATTPSLEEEPSPPAAVGNAIEIPGFGQITTEETGLFLFSTKPERNTLILLGESNQELIGLAGLIATGSLTDCVIRETIATCVFPGTAP